MLRSGPDALQVNNIKEKNEIEQRQGYSKVEQSAARGQDVHLKKKQKGMQTNRGICLHTYIYIYQKGNDPTNGNKTNKYIGIPITRTTTQKKQKSARDAVRRGASDNE